MFSFFKKFRKIIFFSLVFVSLLFFFNLFYNRGIETNAQKDVDLFCEGDEIPLGEALDDAIWLANIVSDNLKIVFDSSQTQLASAKSLFDLPEECKVENCQTRCDISSSGQSKVFASDSPDGLESYALLSSNTVLGYQLAQAAPLKPDNLPVNQACRADGTVDVTFRWNTNVANINLYDYWVWINIGGVSRSRFVGSFSSYLWEELPSNTAISWYVLVREKAHFANKNESVPTSFTSIVCTVCTILPCSGSPCPAGRADALLNQIDTSYNQISSSRTAISNAIPRRDNIIDLLNEARKGLSKCVTPAGADTEAEMREAENLLTCKEAQYEGALPSSKTGCDNPNNFVCCYFK